MGDPARVLQIVRNLVDNAHRHGGGECQIEVGVDSQVGWLEVRDDGPSVDPELRPLLFSPFATSGKPGSTGLGLAVSRELASAMGGDLVHRRSRNQTVFRLELPPTLVSQPI